MAEVHHWVNILQIIFYPDSTGIANALFFRIKENANALFFRIKEKNQIIKKTPKLIEKLYSESVGTIINQKNKYTELNFLEGKNEKRICYFHGLI